jgi:ureidoacrylate peracid hydrolase
VWLRNVWRDAGEIGVLAERRPLLRQTGCRAGTWGAELLDDLAVQVTDTIIDKRRFSGFFGTDLERLLGESGARSVVIAGVRTEHCVESTVRDAFFRDYRVLVPDDAVISYERDLHDGSLRVMGDTFAWVMPTEAVLGLLSDG